MNKKAELMCQFTGYVCKAEDKNCYKCLTKGQEERATISERNAEKLKDRALALWHDLNECTISLKETIEVQEYIIHLFRDVN